MQTVKLIRFSKYMIFDDGLRPKNDFLGKNELLGSVYCDMRLQFLFLSNEPISPIKKQ